MIANKKVNMFRIRAKVGLVGITTEIDFLMMDEIILEIAFLPLLFALKSSQVSKNHNNNNNTLSTDIITHHVIFVYRVDATEKSHHANTSILPFT